jgi:hypothetical protein
MSPEGHLLWNIEPSYGILLQSVALERCMSWTPGLVPFGADETAYLVVDALTVASRNREIEIERADVETIISDMLGGHYSRPIRVVAFNTLEHWSEDVSAKVAEEIRARCDIECTDVPEHIRDFVETAMSLREKVSGGPARPSHSDYSMPGRRACSRA